MNHKWEKVEFDDLVKGDVFRVNQLESNEYIMLSRDLNDNLIKAKGEDFDGSPISFFEGNVFTRKIEIPEETDRLQTAISVLVDKLHTETENHKQTRARLIELQEKWEEKRLVDMGEDICQEEIWEDVDYRGINIGDLVKSGNYKFRIREFIRGVPVAMRGEFVYSHMHHSGKWKRLKKQTCCGTCHGAYDGKAE
jgi:hypothetical protein